LGTSCGKFLGVFAPGPDENAIFAKPSNRNERGVGCGCHIVELSFRRQKFPKTTKIVFYPSRRIVEQSCDFGFRVAFCNYPKLETSWGKFLGVFAPRSRRKYCENIKPKRTPSRLCLSRHSDVFELSLCRQKFPKTTKIVFYPFQVFESLNKVVISAFEWHFVIIDRSISFWCVADNPVARFAYENLHNKVSQLFYSP
jgi:hypothetical protein